MPSLLMVTTVPDTLGGFLAPFAEHFRAQGWRVDGMARGVTSHPECVQAFDRLWDMPWSRSPLNPRNFFTAPAQVREIVTREGYDIVHVHTPIASFVVRMALRKLRLNGKPRLIYTAHGFHFYQGGPRLKGAVYRSMEQLAGRWTDYLVVINREDEQAAQRYGIVPPDRIRYMPGIGVDTAHFSAAAVTQADVDRVRNELRLAPAHRLFLMIGEFNPGKRHRDALHAFARLNRPQSCLAFAGKGPLFDEMKQLAAKLGVAEHVRFLGFRSDIPVLIKASAAMLLPSEREGLPRSVMESMCQGVPVVGTRIRGMTDLLDDGRGLLVPVGDAHAIAAALAWILDRPEEARALGSRGQAAMGAYDLRRIVEMHEDLYAEALGPLAGRASDGKSYPSLARPANT